MIIKPKFVALDSSHLGRIADDTSSHDPALRSSLEWKGSDLIDGHLACLSAYANVTYVDKRTFEALRQARQSSQGLAKIIGRVEKAGNYWNIPEQLTPDSTTMGDNWDNSCALRGPALELTDSDHGK
jgi:hypothetical protein